MDIRLKKGELVKSEAKKISALSVSKDSSNHKEVWTFKREQSFLPFLLQLLLHLGFKKQDFEIRFFFGVPHIDEDGDEEELPDSYTDEPFSNKYLKIDYFNQDFYAFCKKGIDVEVIFFSDRITLVIKGNTNKKRISDFISQFVSFGKKD